MGRTKIKCRRRSKPCAAICNATRNQSFRAGEHVYKGGGRNPFFRFLVHFRRCNREWLQGLPATEVSIMAGTLWRCMCPKEKEPYVEAARKSRYMYWARSQRINWFLRTLRDSCRESKTQCQSSWLLLNAIVSWRQFVIQDLFNFDVK
ncbi:uncharacterized protein Dana_GF19805 [Drosophila ananassae]|uniref:HMG box domain-containing protein n=1 Tax=Drosophila ananassae TaxID=7217 RepID=B3MFE8_DROAN|nr:uncharacterized protein LOC6502548 [Drosophila ananassae]EDV35622.1 uncharacterized protein Dana_GF19805 [Drosophila ananassae]